jgi:hypothetical protein
MKLKTKLAAALLSVVSFGAMADGTISVTSTEAPTTFSSLSSSGTFNPVGVNMTALTAEYGANFVRNATVSFSNNTPVVFTFVGRESWHTSAFGVGAVDSSGNRVLLNTAAPGSMVLSNLLSGDFSFYFYDTADGSLAVNPSFSIGVALNSDSTKALFVFNDTNNAIDGDYDDMVVSVSAIPEVETYAMMLAGLGLMGTIARRRNKAKTA